MPDCGMFDLSAPWWELVIRGLAVYAFLLIMLRRTGKKQVGELSSFDLVLLLILSNAVQNSMNAGDNSLIGGLIVATTLIAANFLVGALTFRSKTIDRLVEGHPQILIHNGILDEKVMASAHLTHHEVNEALRMEGILTVQQVAWAMLETNGRISVIPRKHGADKNSAG